MKFEEDLTNTHKKGLKKLKEVIMVYEDGSTEIVKATEPTMVLIEYSQYKMLKDLYLQIQSIVTNSEDKDNAVQG